MSSWADVGARRASVASQLALTLTLTLTQALALGLASDGAAAQNPSNPYPGIGRAATAQELAAWDIDVRPDFKGLPQGSGSVAQGQVIWEAQCASCHGIFGEANHVFSPLVGGTTAADVKTGRVARLNDASFPGRTTLMKLPTLATLWDYIRRAMPWTTPKSLSTDEVYAVTAFMLNLGGIVPNDYVLSHNNMAATQQRLPNRNGMSLDHALWPGRGLGRGGQPDVKATACMHNCGAEPLVSSSLPEFARNSHGNLAEQQRGVGPQRGADTTRPEAATLAAASAAAVTPALPRPAPPAAVSSGAAAALALAQKHNCLACHGVENRIVGPSLREVAARYAGRADALAYLAGKIQAGSQGVWGPIPMPAQTLPDSDTQAIAAWLASAAQK